MCDLETPNQGLGNTISDKVKMNLTLGMKDISVCGKRFNIYTWVWARLPSFCNPLKGIQLK